MVEYVIAKISVSLYAGAIIFKVVLGVSSQWVSAVCILVATALYTYPPSRSFTITPLLMWSSHFSLFFTVSVVGGLRAVMYTGTIAAPPRATFLWFSSACS